MNDSSYKMIENHADLTGLDGRIENSTLIELMSALARCATECCNTRKEYEKHDQWVTGQIYAVATISRMIGQIKPKAVTEP